MKKMSIFLFLIFSLPILLTGCSTFNPQNNSAEKITFALDWSPNTNHTGLYVAIEKGYFEEQGIEVEIIQPPADGTLEQLVGSGKIQFGISAQEQVTNARVNDIPIVSIAAILQHNTSGFASLADKNIHSPKDFIGKTYGGWGAPSEEAMLKALMEKDGVDFNKLKMVNIGEADQITSLKRDIDIVWIYYGWTGIQAELQGVYLNMLWLKDVDPALDYYTPVIITNEKTIQKQPELVRKFLKAVSQGYTFAAQNPAEAAEIFIRHVPESNQELVRKSQEWLSPLYIDDAERWGIQKESVWHDYTEWLFERSLIPRMIEADKAFTNEFLPGDNK